ncbi:hypothetical protein ACA910_006970 [Epithemia clementina (nom. ined.)]
MSSSHTAGRRPASRGSGGGNRNSNSSSPAAAGGGRSSSSRGGGGTGRGSHHHYHHRHGESRHGASNNGRQGRGRHPHSSPQQDDRPGMRDEDVLIAFMPYLKGNNAEALSIHEEYQSGNCDQKTFLKSARDFLIRESAASSRSSNDSAAPEKTQNPSAPSPSGAMSPVRSSPASSVGPTTTPDHHLPHQKTTTSLLSHQQEPHPPLPSLSQTTTIPVSLSKLFQSPTPNASQNQAPFPALANNSTAVSSFSQATNGSAIDSFSSRDFQPNANTQFHLLQQQHPQHRQPFVQSDEATSELPSEDTPQRVSSFDGLRMTSIERGLDALMMDDGPTHPQSTTSAFSATASYPINNTTTNTPTTPSRIPEHTKQQIPASPDQGASSPWSFSSPAAEVSTLSRSPGPTPNSEPTPGGRDEQTSVKGDIVDPARTPAKKEAPPPKRLWTYPEEQPGRILVKGLGGEDNSLVLPLGPREELTAHWAISIDYLRKHATEKYGPNANLETALSKMTLGLFRRGCTENGTQASIVSKSVLGEFWKDPASNSVCGKVHFYSPRTPGHVVFRLFWEEDPLYTLATGPTILVRVLEHDFESSIRFILSNFKGKKSNPTSLSSLHSLAAILETQITRPNDSAARATWGCVQEARKVLEVCAQEHEKTMAKLAALEASVEELKKKVDLESDNVAEVPESSGAEVNCGEGELSEAAIDLKEKTRILMSGRASCERKWRDSQQAFAGILRAIVVNQSMVILLRRELISKMRIEYELWCPLSEEFAILDESAHIWYEPLRDLPQSLSAADFERFSQARVKMQLRTLGFHPNTLLLEDILYPRDPKNPGQRAVDPGAVNSFNKLSATMGKAFQELYHDEDVVMRRRELVRKRTEDCVNQSGVFPPGTKVVIFGSSANGFGSPNSDVDMCLQLPDSQTSGGPDLNGADAMSKLADFMKDSGGMVDVDTARLSARIPVVMYRCPNPLPLAENDNNADDFIECDISMHNPLAVLNTSLLQAYSNITPITRVLSLIIKRWAKARDINNPARHTLSSYGYIIMLLHFLTYHKRSGNGLVSPVARPEGDPRFRHPAAQRPTPILPNLQWMDPAWPNSPRGTPYRDLPSLPREIALHPLEEGKRVNRHFYRASTPNEAALLQMHFAGNDLSLAILLASFFRYYAYEFDYKRFVVSLHSTGARGVVEREVKAELDGWRNYSAALTIEDPFETFYDVAHVLRGGYYHRIRREFAVAYSKIADVATGRPGSWNKADLRSMSGEEVIEWLCEPIEKERTSEDEP